MRVALTRREGTMLGIVIILCLLNYVQWVYYHMDDIDEIPGYQQPRGPNPDGSWGKYIEPPVKIGGVQVDIDKGKIAIFVIVDMGAGGKYTTHIVLPVDRTLEAPVASTIVAGR